MRRLAVLVDDWALAALPGLDVELARAGAVVARSYQRLPAPAALRRWPECQGVAVLGGPDLASLRDRLETATATLGAPVIAALPPGLAPLPELRGPGVVDLLPAGTPRAAERVALMARVPIVTGGARRRTVPSPSPGPVPSPSRSPSPSPSPTSTPTSTATSTAIPAPPPSPPDHVLAIASSTGGVWVLASLLQALRSRERIAVLLAQHMEAEFVPSFAAWLESVTPWPAVLVEDAAPLQAGRLYLAAGGRDLVAEGARALALPPASRYVPCADRLLASVARAHRARAVALVLSGMGADGAEGLAEVGRAGGRAVCQAPQSAVVASMPEAALRRWPGAEVAPPEALAAVVGRCAWLAAGPLG